MIGAYDGALMPGGKSKRGILVRSEGGDWKEDKGNEYKNTAKLGCGHGVCGFKRKYKIFLRKVFLRFQLYINIMLYICICFSGYNYMNKVSTK